MNNKKKSRGGTLGRNNSRSINNPRGNNVSTEGVYGNPALMHATSLHIGNTMQIMTFSGAIWEGIFRTVSSDFDVVLEVATPVIKGSDGTQTLDINKARDKLIFRLCDIIWMTARDADLDYPTHDTFQLDSNISKFNGQVSRSEERELEPWDGCGSTNDDDDTGIELDSGSNGWDANEMFRKNEQVYGVTSNFDQSLTGYTVQLEQKDTADYKIAEAKAAEIAKEIESKPSYNQHAEIENADENEEERFAAVVRPETSAANSNDNGNGSSNNNARNTNTTGSSEKYIPPCKRTAQEGKLLPSSQSNHSQNYQSRSFNSNHTNVNGNNHNASSKSHQSANNMIQQSNQMPHNSPAPINLPGVSPNQPQQGNGNNAPSSNIQISAQSVTATQHQQTSTQQIAQQQSQQHMISPQPGGPQSIPLIYQHGAGGPIHHQQGAHHGAIAAQPHGYAAQIQQQPPPQHLQVIQMPQPHPNISMAHPPGQQIISPQPQSIIVTGNNMRPPNNKSMQQQRLPNEPMQSQQQMPVNNNNMQHQAMQHKVPEQSRNIMGNANNNMQQRTMYDNNNQNNIPQPDKSQSQQPKNNSNKGHHNRHNNAMEQQNINDGNMPNETHMTNTIQHFRKFSNEFTLVSQQEHQQMIAAQHQQQQLHPPHSVIIPHHGHHPMEQQQHHTTQMSQQQSILTVMKPGMQGAPSQHILSPQQQSHIIVATTIAGAGSPNAMLFTPVHQHAQLMAQLQPIQNHDVVMPQQATSPSQQQQQQAGIIPSTSPVASSLSSPQQTTSIVGNSHPQSTSPKQQVTEQASAPLSTTTTTSSTPVTSPSASVTKSKLNPLAKEFNPFSSATPSNSNNGNAAMNPTQTTYTKNFTPRSPSTPLSASRPHTPQTPGHPYMPPTPPATMPPATVLNGQHMQPPLQYSYIPNQPYQNPPQHNQQTRYRKDQMRQLVRSDQMQQMQVAAATGPPILAPGIPSFLCPGPTGLTAQSYPQIQTVRMYHESPPHHTSHPLSYLPPPQSNTPTPTQAQSYNAAGQPQPQQLPPQYQTAQPTTGGPPHPPSILYQILPTGHPHAIMQGGMQYIPQPFGGTPPHFILHQHQPTAQSAPPQSVVTAGQQQ